MPVGRYTAPRICDEATLRAAAAVLRSPSVTLHHRTFTAVAVAAGPGDLVYFDPPYAPLSATSRFTSYTSGSFSDEDQRALRQLAVQLAESRLRGGRQQFDGGRRDRAVPGARSPPRRFQDLPHPRPPGHQLEGGPAGYGRRIYHQQRAAFGLIRIKSQVPNPKLQCTPNFQIPNQPANPRTLNLQLGVGSASGFGPWDLGFGSRSPTASTCPCVRQNIVPSEKAGVASVLSPISFVAASS